MSFIRGMFRTFTFSTFLLLCIILQSCNSTSDEQVLIKEPTVVTGLQELNFSSKINGTSVKKVIIDLDNKKTYGNLSLYANNELLVENLNIPQEGVQQANVLVKFKDLGKIDFRIEVRDCDLVINKLTLIDVEGLAIPNYEDITIKVGMDKVSSLKYGGPTVADIDNDGDYDFIVNNHNQETSKLYWNNGDGTVTRHTQDLARWFMHDLHGTSVGDYDNDGDLDLIVCQGGGNGTNPSKANFYLNDDSNFVRYTGDVGIDRGARGRGARWGDFDLDGDLDLILVNEEGLKKEKPQHFFYENLGDGTFEFKKVPELQDEHQSRALITDVNGDNIDDIVLYGPVSIWIGNGDFTFTNVTAQMLKGIETDVQIMAIADLDIDNDGDLDLYLARGKAFEGGQGESPSIDSDPKNNTMALKSRGYKGVDTFELIGDTVLKMENYYYLSQKTYRGKVYPIFLGKEKTKHLVASGQDFEFIADKAQGWPDDISENGFYIGYVGDNKWKAALVRNGDLFWSYKYTLTGVQEIIPDFIPTNRNEQDVLLQNDNGVFVDVSKDWNIQSSPNSLGVTVGDFNNDSYQDIFVYRWGFIDSRTSDYMLLNTGKGSFETVTMHGANAIGGPGNGDMGQAFDFDLDGSLDILSGSEGGEWYLYNNKSTDKGNYSLVRVGYAPKSNVDAIGAEVIVNTAKNTYKKRVGSAGEVFSQSLLNIVHFGLGGEDHIERVQVRWRNGETVTLLDKSANSIIDTNQLDPIAISFENKENKIRRGGSLELQLVFDPSHSNKKVSWSSSDTSVLQVNKEGMVTAVGEVEQKAMITATSGVNAISVSKELEIEDWYAIPVQSIEISKEGKILYDNSTVQLTALTSPMNADDQEFIWSSSDSSIATVDAKGTVAGHKSGEVVIKVKSKSDASVCGEVKLTVAEYIEPYVKILNKKKYKSLKAGQKVKLEVEYHAGSGNRVIFADEGGVRLWLRHFKNKWIPIKDVVLVDETALGKTSGVSSKTFSLEGYVPSNQLEGEEFYMLRATFTSSDGVMYYDDIYPLNIK